MSATVEITRCCGTCRWWDTSMSGNCQFFDGQNTVRGDACRRAQWSYPPMRPSVPNMEILTMQTFCCSAWSEGGPREGKR
jgi:hypothetical protein